VKKLGPVPVRGGGDNDTSCCKCRTSGLHERRWLGERLKRRLAWGCLSEGRPGKNVCALTVYEVKQKECFLTMGQATLRLPIKQIAGASETCIEGARTNKKGRRSHVGPPSIGEPYGSQPLRDKKVGRFALQPAMMASAAPGAEFLGRNNDTKRAKGPPGDSADADRGLRECDVSRSPRICIGA